VCSLELLDALSALEERHYKNLLPMQHSGTGEADSAVAFQLTWNSLQALFLRPTLGEGILPKLDLRPGKMKSGKSGPEASPPTTRRLLTTPHSSNVALPVLSPGRPVVQPEMQSKAGQLHIGLSIKPTDKISMTDKPTDKPVAGLRVGVDMAPTDADRENRVRQWVKHGRMMGTLPKNGILSIGAAQEPMDKRVLEKVSADLRVGKAALLAKIGSQQQQQSQLATLKATMGIAGQAQARR